MKYRDYYIEGTGNAKIVKALSNEVRLKILEYLDEEEMNIQQLSKALELGKTTVLKHISILEESGFIETVYVSGTVGNQKVCKKKYDRLIFNFSPNKFKGDTYKKHSIAVGNYFDCDVYAPCGLASKNKIINTWDQPNVFYKKNRVNASLCWMSFGYLEYCLPIEDDWNDLEISLELSSQGDIKNHKELSYPSEVSINQYTDNESDITFWLNGYELGTITCKDFSKGTGGKYTPTWWGGSNYGELITININDGQCEINGINTGQIIDFEYLRMQKILKFRIGVKADANKISGFNIYGKDFGNYAQDIVFKIK